MAATQTAKGSTPEKPGLITVVIWGAVLIGASIWFLVRALSGSPDATADHASPSVGESTAINDVIAQDEMDKQTAPAILFPAAAQPAVIPTNRNDNEVILQKTKTKVNQQLVKRLKQYVKDNPYRDNRALEQQIKIRENQCSQTP